MIPSTDTERAEHNARVEATREVSQELQRLGVHLSWPTVLKLVDIARRAPAGPVRHIACACGDEFPAGSYGAGFLDAKGRCFGCDAAHEAGNPASAMKLPEPVAWMHVNRLGASQAFTSEPPPGFKAQCAPLYTEPQVRALLASATESRQRAQQELEDFKAKTVRIGLDIDRALRGEVNEESPIASRLRVLASARAVQPAIGIPISALGKCWCTTCRPITLEDARFVVCPDCGNKRCPRAHNHELACTNSNAPGQTGSSWEHVKPAAAPKENAP
ncbi:hypothetical protein [Comamonas antarctica]|uniref:hypothetical protein n=1 Tax=Comamonas antarctica TaxID=2743470 RepID=UPI0028E5C240|nr:hypothetical protein [Comamonas antarctica]